MVRTYSTFAALALLAAPAAAYTVTLRNKCTFPIELFDASRVESISVGGSVERSIPPNSGAHVFRHSRNAQATLAEFSGDGGMAWFDISIIPTGPKSGPDYCPSLDACKSHTGGVGFNVPMQIAPSSPDGNRCRVLTCMADGCSDAYQYPKDDTKTHTCPLSTNFDVTFCPGGSGGATQAPAPTPPPTTQAPPTPPPTTKAPQTPPPTTQAPTPSPTPEPTTQAPTTQAPTPMPSPTPEVANEASSSSSSLLRTGSNGAGSDRSIDDTTTAPSTTDAGTEPASAGVAVASTAAPAADTVTSAGGTAGGNVQTVTTRTQNESTTPTGVYFIAVVAAVAMVAGTAIVVVRRKKAQLDALETKSPAIGATTTGDGRMMMTTPSGSCIL